MDDLISRTCTWEVVFQGPERPPLADREEGDSEAVSSPCDQYLRSIEAALCWDLSWLFDKMVVGVCGEGRRHKTQEVREILGLAPLL